MCNARRMKMSKGYMYILKCADGSFYTGSTRNLEKRIFEHQSGCGANFTRRHLPVKLIYFEEYDRIDDAYLREKTDSKMGYKKENSSY